ncbi:BQ5605_C034g11303 [Microbotryum silenes-dioicae]|uniref:BQ5605_C034g11303 protein n=1 Tax=Microbotryum silenes-dioicae TaxID=796604 RepID=A0A2X0N2Q3_9BASI|nr:BQ5605_C034g11303 [Microbotryum silenes-dioicae]
MPAKQGGTGRPRPSPPSLNKASPPSERQFHACSPTSVEAPRSSAFDREPPKQPDAIIFYLQQSPPSWVPPSPAPSHSHSPRSSTSPRSCPPSPAALLLSSESSPPLRSSSSPSHPDGRQDRGQAQADLAVPRSPSLPSMTRCPTAASGAHPFHGDRDQRDNLNHPMPATANNAARESVVEALISHALDCEDDQFFIEEEIVPRVVVCNSPDLVYSAVGWSKHGSRHARKKFRSAPSQS